MAKREKEQEKQAVSQSGGAAPVRADSISTELDELVTVVLEVWGRGYGKAEQGILLDHRVQQRDEVC